MYKQIYDGLIIETLCKYRDMSAQITSRIEQILQNMCSDEELMQVASMPGKSGEGNSNAEKFYDLSDVYEDFLKLKDKQAEEARLQIRELVERQETVNRIMTCYYVLPMEMQEVLEMLYISSETPKEGMDDVKNFLASLNEADTKIDTIAVASENNVLGYKVLKITATEDQMASIMDLLEMMGVEVEEIEDGMPKTMEELTKPYFDSFVAFDIETTGSNGAANGDSEAQITEIGAVKVVNGLVVEKFDQLANPGRPITPMISKITHITNEMVADMPPIDEVIKMFHEFVGNNILVGHNIKSSDLRYITKAANRAGIHFDSQYLDTYILAKKFKNEQGWGKLNLGYLAGEYGFEHKEAHRAWSDAEVNAEVYFELKKLYE